MECTINSRGQLEIKPIRSIESYALQSWLENNPEAVSLKCLKFHSISLLEDLGIEKVSEE